MESLLKLFLSAWLAVGAPFALAVSHSRGKRKDAAARAAVPATLPVEKILAKYRAGKTFQAKVKKTVTQEVMGTSNQSSGRFYFSKGKLRMDMEKPERSSLVYDGKNIWLEARLDDTHVQVSRLKSGELKKTDSILAALFDRKDVLKKFVLLKTNENSGHIYYSFEPRQKKETEVQFLEIGLKGQEISRIRYKDQMENEVNFEFTDLSRENVPADKFKYTPPVGASVTDL